MTEDPSSMDYQSQCSKPRVSLTICIHHMSFGTVAKSCFLVNSGSRWALDGDLNPSTKEISIPKGAMTIWDCCGLVKSWFNINQADFKTTRESCASSHFTFSS
jgi:hypothetical protein